MSQAVELTLPKRTVSAGKSIPSVLISFYACLLILLGFVISSKQFLHWFVIPVFLGGVLIGIDAVDWFRGRLDVFDPIGVLGLLGVHFFFLAPFLHILWGTWMPYVIPPDDWRPWLGGMAILNLLGIIGYRFIVRRPVKPDEKSTNRAIWAVNDITLPPILLAALLCTAGLQLVVYARFGGIGGYVGEFEKGSTGFSGMGWVFMISESFPILAMMGFAVIAQKRPVLKSWVAIIIVLAIFFLAKMLFGGLRGSRANTIFGLMWGLGIIHYWIRPIPRKVVYVGIVFLVAFMYLYGFYKSGGPQAVSSLNSLQDLHQREEKTGRTLTGSLLGDLGRSDVQAFMLYRLLREDSDYTYAWGRTYYAATAIVIPKSIWPDRPVSKWKEGTDLLFGAGSYIPGKWVDSHVYGLAGEAMLNFGPLVVPFSFIFLGILVRRVRRWISTGERSDLRYLFLPFLTVFCIIFLISDLENDIFYLVKEGLVPFAVFFLGSKRLIMGTRSS
jgi:hypothetical protein